MSHPGRGAWIETDNFNPNVIIPGRTPGGVRGLKQRFGFINQNKLCRTPGGVRGLKPNSALAMQVLRRRTPGGVRGLKLQQALYCL